MQGVALLSGGLDSGVAAAVFCAEPANELRAALFCDYGQRAAAAERRAATLLAARFGAPLHDYELPWLAELAERSGAAVVDAAAALPQATAGSPGDEASARAVWVPARNAVFVSVAAALAETLGADCVVAGFNREEAETFPDNSRASLDAATTFLSHGTRDGIAVLSPTIDWDKERIVTEARHLGFGPGDFWSCYEGGDAPCGRCESCVRSRFTR